MDDPLGIWGVRVFLLGSLGAIAVLTSYFDSFGAALLAVALMTSFLLVIGRVIAESGLAAFQAAETLSTVSIGLGFPLILPINGMLALLWMSTVMVEDTRSNLTGYAVQGAAMAERAKQPPRLVFTLATLVVIGAALLAVTAQLISTWTGDGNGIKPTDFGLRKTVAQAQNPSTGGFFWQHHRTKQYSRWGDLGIRRGWFTPRLVCLPIAPHWFSGGHQFPNFYFMG